MTTPKNDTPMLRQYKDIKAQAQDAILFFRLGDFYEMFLDDAVLAAKELDLTLTGRGKDENRIPMCGVPYHAADNYIPRLINKGYKVAICEQVEDASVSKGLTKREIIKVITPGTMQGEGVLEESSNNYLLAAAYNEKNQTYPYCFADISTGEFSCGIAESRPRLLSLQGKLGARELILSENLSLDLPKNILQNQRNFLDQDRANSCLKTHFGLNSLDSFGLMGYENSFPAAWALISYVKDTQKQGLAQLTRLQAIRDHNKMALDATSIRNLDLLCLPNRDKKGSLLWALDHCKTAMGSRFLKNAIISPLQDPAELKQRYNAVDALKTDLLSREEIRDLFKPVQDIERILSRIVSRLDSPKDLMSLKESLDQLQDIPTILDEIDCDTLARLNNTLKTSFAEDGPCGKLIQLINAALVENPPVTLRDGYVIQDGYNPDLDALKQSFKDIKTWIAGLETQEKEATGIKTLKVGFNKVFGYYIEVSKLQSAQVPEHYIRKQTLTNAERYITPELKEKETILLTGEEKQIAMEKEIYAALIEQITPYTADIQALSQTVAELDFYQSLATIAQRHNYSRPEFSDTPNTLNITQSRHPVLERNSDVHFIPNTIQMSESAGTFHLITGPNMAGKSTLMRQLALTLVMAQIGSFVPATKMVFSPVDAIFTRIGAMDNLYAGQSTYMVEMVETAAILNAATKNSLILLDEIGRGTATYDGMSIAWAITEHIHNHLNARTLFATHYHELTVLEDSLSHLKNYSMKITESEGDIVFQYELVTGPADKSYGIHVAKLAGLPGTVIDKASKLLAQFEAKGTGDLASSAQLSLF